MFYFFSSISISGYFCELIAEDVIVSFLRLVSTQSRMIPLYQVQYHFKKSAENGAEHCGKVRHLCMPQPFSCKMNHSPQCLRTVAGEQWDIVKALLFVL